MHDGRWFGQATVMREEAWLGVSSADTTGLPWVSVADNGKDAEPTTSFTIHTDAYESSVYLLHAEVVLITVTPGTL